jgi:3-dehydroquinate dehydratase type I
MVTLRRAAELGAAYIDVELAAVDALTLSSTPLPPSTQLILSHHNFEHTVSKEELQQTEQRMRSCGAAIAKIAMTATDVADSWTMLEVLQQRSGVGG